MEKRRSLKYKTGDIHQRRGNVLLLISWTDRKKFVTRERVMNEVDQISAGASLCESRRQNIPTGDWSADGNKLLTISSKPDSVHV